jgi:hypothetical protein
MRAVAATRLSRFSDGNSGFFRDAWLSSFRWARHLAFHFFLRPCRFEAFSFD